MGWADGRINLASPLRGMGKVVGSGWTHMKGVHLDYDRQQLIEFHVVNMPQEATCCSKMVFRGPVKHPIARLNTPTGIDPDYED
jgi:hypothetical protein